MPDAALLAAVAAGAGLVSCFGTRALIPLLRAAAVLDRPNKRSLHAAPIPRGGGIAVIGAILLVWLALMLARTYSTWLSVFILGGLALAVVSWIDDLRGLPPAVRLMAQF